MPVRSVYADPNDEVAELLVDVSQRLLAAELLLARLQPGPWVYPGQTVGGVVGPAWEHSYRNFGAGHQEMRYRREGDLVRMEGVLANDAVTITNGVSAFTVTPDYAPAAIHQIKQRTAATGGGAAAGYEMINIFPTGLVVVYATAGSGTFSNASGDYAVAIETTYAL